VNPRLLLASSPTHNIYLATTTNNTITNHKHTETHKYLSRGSVTPQSCAYVPVVEATTKVLRVSFNPPLFPSDHKDQAGVSTRIKGNTNFSGALTSTSHKRHQATPSWLGFQEPRVIEIKSNRRRVPQVLKRRILLLELKSTKNSLQSHSQRWESKQE